MVLQLSTERLSLGPLQPIHADFIKTLVNTEGWLTFIGQRNVHSYDDAIAYIEKINNAPGIQYWVVSLKKEETPIGIITFIKRDYLPHHDIGFAFLPGYNGNGYAYEASKAILTVLRSMPGNETILATTLPSNITSIKLLNKLGLTFSKEINVENSTLHLYTT
jgi:ribosomal-protein-alanine N-acetyltransferase